ncbi:hypothetical protein ElyMa_003598200 [Elysia marginata]|uniref:Uncharacterized protein n=1 Tax=Elysia marginata TaxID=1093978 RepID=A0AAV4ERU5_9GAST|nr:hypothetical protein ElyMa_003598200 [Elysia marginata]
MSSSSDRQLPIKLPIIFFYYRTTIAIRPPHSLLLTKSLTAHRVAGFTPERLAMYTYRKLTTLTNAVRGMTGCVPRMELTVKTLLVLTSVNVARDTPNRATARVKESFGAVEMTIALRNLCVRLSEVGRDVIAYKAITRNSRLPTTRGIVQISMNADILKTTDATRTHQRVQTMKDPTPATVSLDTKGSTGFAAKLIFIVFRLCEKLSGEEGIEPTPHGHGCKRSSTGPPISSLRVDRCKKPQLPPQRSRPSSKKA